MTRDLRNERPIGLFPPLAPYEAGWLAVGGGHAIYWESCGNPRGQPIVFLHGGPGGGCGPEHRRFFDPAQFRAILFDQRGCGRSTPSADTQNNTTQDLVEDLERLRKARGVSRWLMLGGSWGSTLALAYAEQFPERVAGLVLRGIFTARKSELDWLYRSGASCIFPEAWAEFISPVPRQERGDLVAAYRRRLIQPSRAEQLMFARSWCAWEAAVMTLRPRPRSAVDSIDDAAVLALAKIETHYFAHGAFLDEGQLIRDAGALTDVPGVIVQGRYDCVTPPTTAVALHHAWPGSRLCIAPDAGHASSEPGIMHGLLEALDAMANGETEAPR